MKPYDPQTIEEKWLAIWKKNRLFQGTAHAQSSTDAEKFYILYAFAYPSGSGLHVGHVEPTTALDMLARYSRMAGKDVFFPVGWDAFGLPAENYAIKTGVHPAKTTVDSIHNFEKQIARVGISYDWDTEVATCHPGYYKWTQWIFVKLFKAGLAYRDSGWVNWCPQDKTVLSNEQVVDGKCERCGTVVVQRELEQWKFRITKYQDELLSGLNQVDWPKSTKIQQENWIGKKEGVVIDHKVTDLDITLTSFSAYPAWLFADTFLVLAPEHPLVEKLVQGTEYEDAVRKFILESREISADVRNEDKYEKKGVFTGRYVTDPFSGKQMPVWLANFALMNFGTGIIRCSAHDPRDYEFAQKYAIELREVVERQTGDETPVNAHGNSGMLKDSGPFAGREINSSLITEMLNWIEQQGFGRRHTTYKLRDWLISRQRYWGAPIPMVFCGDCAKNGKGERPEMPGWYSVAQEQLPVMLPDVPDFMPTDDGLSPIEKASDEWKYVACPGCGGKSKREVDTMDTFVDSSWYFLRYTDARNEKEFAAKEQLARWLPVDTYLIGPEHTVLHLLYSRFFTKFLRDEGYLTFDEPFMKMRHQGMILGPDGKKMSKSKGNVINPDDVIEKFGADTLRVYEMFMGPLDADKAWDTSAVAGVYRFLSKIQVLVHKNQELLSGKAVLDPVLQKKLHKTIKKVGEDIPVYKFNTAIASLMELCNLWNESLGEKKGLSQEDLGSFVKIIAPFAPFLSEELYEELQTGSDKSVHQQTWPAYDPALIQDEEVEIVVQLNSRVKGRFMISQDLMNDKQALEDKAKEVLHLDGIEESIIQKIIVVPGKLVNVLLKYVM